YDRHELFVRIRQRMEVSPFLQLVDLSDALRIERHTIEKAVKEATGSTFRDLRAEILLKRAIRLLGDNPGHSIKEISFSLGYNSQRSFCRFVRTTAGCSPTELRGRKRIVPEKNNTTSS